MENTRIISKSNTKSTYLGWNEYTVMTQEDLAVFIDRIIVKKDKIEIETIDNQKCEFTMSKLK